MLLVLLSVFCGSAEHLTAIVHLHPQNQSHLTHLTTIHPHLIIQVTEPPIKTPTFRKWKKAQYNCQDGKCAWCGCQLDLHSPYTQVDHLKPLCKGGSPTDFDNLVLACKSCNYWCKKGNYTWRDKNGTVHNGWNKPSWIKDNPIKNATTQKDTEDTDPIYDLSDIPF